MITKYIEQIKIFNHYTDLNGKLFVKALCDLMNDTAEQQTEILHVDVDTLNARGQTWMLHRLHILIDSLPLKGEMVTIETWPSGIDRLFALRDYRMMSMQGKELLKITSEWMQIDLTRRRPTRLSEEVITMSTEHKIPKIQIPDLLDDKNFSFEPTASRMFVATYDNIDFNRHVTQASYMRWITNALPFEFLKTHQLKEIEVVYEHEILADSQVNSFYRLETVNDQIVVSHLLQGSEDHKRHCIAKSVWI